MPLEVYTAKMGYRGPDWLDVSLQGNMRRGDTATGGHRGVGYILAPPPSLVFPFLQLRKAGRETPATQAEYRERYLQHLRDRYRGAGRRAFDTVLSWPRVVLLCFCKPGEFCHRHLLAEVLVKTGERHAIDVVLRGELAAGAEPEGAPFWVSAPTEREVKRAVAEGAATPFVLEPPPGLRLEMGPSSGGCTPVAFYEGEKRVGAGFVCGRGGRRKTRCKGSPSCVSFSAYLCDFPLDGKKRGKTCSLPICEKCARAMGPDLHYCPVHHAYDPEGARLPKPKETP